MKRLRWLILLFTIAIAVPMAYVVVRTYHGVAQEENARMRFFAEALFDTMETALAERVEIEENRPVDAYHHTLTVPQDGEDIQTTSPLATPPSEPYILGYLQNNPDGSFQTPLLVDGKTAPPALQGAIRQLEDINRQINLHKGTILTPSPKQPETVKKTVAAKEEEEPGFAEQFIDLKRKRSSDVYLGRKSQRTQEITSQQALNIARQDTSAFGEKKPGTAYERAAASSAPAAVLSPRAAPAERTASLSGKGSAVEADAPAEARDLPARFQAELAPLQSLFINTELIFIYRRVAINQRIYRQGFILEIQPFLNYMAERHFTPQPMARFARLHLQITGLDNPGTIVEVGAAIKQAQFSLERRFPAPFDFLEARLASDQIPTMTTRQTLNIIVGVLAAVFLFGLGAIYRSAHAMAELSDRRARFVASVTHELKTPLTNIRMYVEMLAQGIARDTAREQDYLRVVGSESARLSGLINNVLELSRLEKKQRQFDMRPGSFQEVMEEVRDVMAEKVRQEKFTLTMTPSHDLEFTYDREVMVQILINLIENSIKFGRQSATRQITVTVEGLENHVAIRVSDTGPGIARHALKKIFDDFYRVEDALTRTTGGTGIGLSLVKKFAMAMGGSVKAANNDGPGCTITLRMPRT